MLLLFSLAVAEAAEQRFVAVIITGDLPRYRLAHEAFVHSLEANGYDKEKVQIYVQTPNPDPISWANSIRKAVGIGADLILTYGASPTLVAKKEARGIPLVFADVFDPVGLAIVGKDNPPGGTITGISGNTPLETLVKTFREIYPLKKLAVLYSSIDQGSSLQLRKLGDLAAGEGFELLPLDVRRPEDAAALLAERAGDFDSIFVSESPVVHLSAPEVLQYARQAGLPVVSQVPGICDLGGMISLEADPLEQGEVAASYVMQILSGSKPGRLSVKSPRRVALVINLKTARELHLKVPFQALSMATRVVQ
ncbi:ABC transporter substrate-binding protein [Desulfuromonas versatilis]|uniref:ABC transporter substrate-binding protein n=1 Tax=Desulfuromonas versatilis TaxID=2802975 RepID=A0ABM8HST5_9BACT|nr:ABC transporter substrate-binding protein [Desulfuromonas versatilis]BCR04970.1 ABC transporter substrate-binding protein [Desulfuromonas versatilis]